MGRTRPAAGDRAARVLSPKNLAAPVAIVAMVAGWHVASLVGPAYAFPSWARILSAVAALPAYDIFVTLVRVVISLSAAFVLGLITSVLLYERPVAEAFVLPFVRLLMAVPAVCWVVFAILWFRDTELRIFFVMVVVCAPVFIVDGIDAMKAVPAELRQMAESFWPSRLQIMTKIVFPAIVPNLLTSWKINMTNGLRIVTIAELVGALTGIGRGLVIAQEMFSVSQVFAWTVVLVVMLFVFQGLFGVLERHALRWRS